VLSKITLRAKVLIGIAVACAGYIVMMPDASQTIEPTHGGNTPASSAPVRGAAASGAITAGASASGATASGTTAPGAVPTSRAIRPATAARKSSARVSLNASDRVAKDTAAADLFAAHSWYVAPPPPPPPPPAAYQPPPPPTAPPLPFAFMGSFRTETGGAIYYLTAGDRVYDVKVGDTLDNTYSVDGVKSGQLLLTYMPLKIQQTIAVGDE
jgi:hypothetical protein